MKQRNVREILENFDREMNLWSPMIGECVAWIYDKNYIAIQSTLEGRHSFDNVPIFLDKDGKYSEWGECLLFPSKDHRKWSSCLPLLLKEGDCYKEDGRYYKVTFKGGNTITVVDTIGQEDCFGFSYLTSHDGFIDIVTKEEFEEQCKAKQYVKITAENRMTNSTVSFEISQDEFDQLIALFPRKARNE